MPSPSGRSGARYLAHPVAGRDEAGLLCVLPRVRRHRSMKIVPVFRSTLTLVSVMLPFR